MKNYTYAGTVIIRALCLSVLMLSGCIFSYQEKIPSKPSIKTVSVVNGEIFTVRDITVSWEGNDTAVFFQYTIDADTSGVLTETSVTLTDLDESEHVFVLTALNDSLTISSIPVTRRFTVDAVQGPGIVFSPRKIEHESTVTIYLADVSEIMAVHLELIPRNKCVLFGSFVPNEALTLDGDVISIYDSGKNERIIIDIGFAGETRGISGSLINIGTLTVNPLREGTVEVDSLKTLFRTISNETVSKNGLDFMRVIQ
ncbi:hypothetical protein LLG96_04695 [bacterium]|nr:hypothetical protein [bacterium]